MKSLPFAPSIQIFLSRIIAGLVARYSSTGIRGHGIPEAMEQAIMNESNIPPD